MTAKLVKMLITGIKPTGLKNRWYTLPPVGTNNGKTIGTKEVINHRVVWSDVKLATGENNIQASASHDDKKLVDQVVWRLH